VSGFSADWLALREPYDAAARPAALVAMLRAHVVAGTAATPLEIVDLGAGAGSNLRYLAPLLGGEQRWRLVDHDPRLLDAGVAATHAWADTQGAEVRRAGSTLTIRGAGFAAEVRCEPADLTDLDAIELPARGLVTAAALLDLVSRGWLDALAGHCFTARAAVCFALTYDGRMTAIPGDSADSELVALFNRHQLGDKGFGPALGPDAAAAAAASFQALGYDMRTDASDWSISPEHSELQLALLDGWRGAAAELAPAQAPLIEAWHARRCEHLAAGRSQLRVGHIDLVGWL
jgi:hypothetical protein